MEKIIKTLPELKSIIDANKFHTFDYTEGLSVSDGIEIFEIDIEETDDYQGASATLCIYPNEDILFNEDPTKAKQEIIDQVNNIYGNEKLTFFSLQGIQEYFETIHLECQEISFNRGGTVIQKQGIPEL